MLHSKVKVRLALGSAFLFALSSEVFALGIIIAIFVYYINMIVTY